MMDVRVQDQGSVAVFILETDLALDWVHANVSVPDYMWMGSQAFACEHRLCMDIMMGMMNDGLEVQSEY